MRSATDRRRADAVGYPRPVRARSVVPLVCLAGVLATATLCKRREAAPPTPPPTAPTQRTDEPPAERPPEFPPVADEADLVRRWIVVLSSGDDSDVSWAAGRLRRAGDDARKAVREAGFASIETNPALVEQALEILLSAPRDDDAPFARAALATKDVDAVFRAIRLLGVAPGPDRAAAARAVAEASLPWDARARVEAATALTKIGGDAAAEQAVRVAAAAPATERAAILGALTDFKNERIREATRSAFAEEKAPYAKAKLGEALLREDDASPVPELERLLDSPEARSTEIADAALSALSVARHAGALKRIGAIARDVQDDANRRVTMLGLLAAYPPAETIPILEAVAADGPGVRDDVRIEAFESLIRIGAPGAFERVLSFAERGDRRAANLAALVFGSVRRRDAASRLLAASARPDFDADTRTMLLRAVVLSSAPECAAPVVRAMTQDVSAYGARKTTAQNVASELPEATPEFRRAAGAALVAALEDDAAPPVGAGLLHSLHAVADCCGAEAAPAVERRLTHADLPIRAVAATTLGLVAGPNSEKELRAAWWRAAEPWLRAVIAKAMERAHYRGRG